MKVLVVLVIACAVFAHKVSERQDTQTRSPLTQSNVPSSKNSQENEQQLGQIGHLKGKQNIQSLQDKQQSKLPQRLEEEENNEEEPIEPNLPDNEDEDEEEDLSLKGQPKQRLNIPHQYGQQKNQQLGGQRKQRLQQNVPQQQFGQQKQRLQQGGQQQFGQQKQRLQQGGEQQFGQQKQRLHQNVPQQFGRMQNQQIGGLKSQRMQSNIPQQQFGGLKGQQNTQMLQNEDQKENQESEWTLPEPNPMDQRCPQIQQNIVILNENQCKVVFKCECDLKYVDLHASINGRGLNVQLQQNQNGNTYETIFDMQPNENMIYWFTFEANLGGENTVACDSQKFTHVKHMQQGLRQQQGGEQQFGQQKQRLQQGGEQQFGQQKQRLHQNVPQQFGRMQNQQIGGLKSQRMQSNIPQQQFGQQKQRLQQGGEQQFGQQKQRLQQNVPQQFGHMHSQQVGGQQKQRMQSGFGRMESTLPQQQFGQQKQQFGRMQQQQFGGQKSQRMTESEQPQQQQEEEQPLQDQKTEQDQWVLPEPNQADQRCPQVNQQVIVLNENQCKVLFQCDADINYVDLHASINGRGVNVKLEKAQASGVKKSSSGSNLYETLVEIKQGETMNYWFTYETNLDGINSVACDSPKFTHSK